MNVCLHSQQIYKEWVRVIGGDIAAISPTTVRKKGRVCESHFSRSQYYITRQKQRRLRKDSIPQLGKLNSHVFAVNLTFLCNEIIPLLNISHLFQIYLENRCTLLDTLERKELQLVLQ